ncbi:MAG: replication-associated recombination protein A [Cytophagales bacterium]|nr:MAG: replication-associated recombination protein A [Cytophagales bacterium]TAF59432.1 MAG: replication-associated recombination protein A [Cytophagales bacterium]
MFESHQMPLAERMRPKKLSDVLGQSHLTAENGVFERALKGGHLPSLIFWGPPGTGKTTLAMLLAEYVKMPFEILSAVQAGVKDVRQIIDKARTHRKTVLFIDEIHRFNKSQQDALLAAVERGYITLIGATTENPSFEINSALLSRCQVYTLKPLSEEALKDLAQKALQEDSLLKKREARLQEFGAIWTISGGDARKMLNLLELVVFNLGEQIDITDDLVMQIAQQHVAVYDKSGEQHYDIISAFIKSIRGSDPNAALYWLACMLDGGEDVKFIARRLLILASEDIGNANPTALVIATTTFQAVSMVGMPESDLILSQCVIYLASSPKSNSAYTAIRKAQKLCREQAHLPVPMHLRNAPTSLMRQSGYGKGYLYPHDMEQNFAEQEYLPTQISGTAFYEPSQNARENDMRQFLKKRWKDKYKY